MKLRCWPYKFFDENVLILFSDLKLGDCHLISLDDDKEKDDGQDIVSKYFCFKFHSDYVILKYLILIHVLKPWNKLADDKDENIYLGI